MEPDTWQNYILISSFQNQPVCQRWQAFMITIFISTQNPNISNKHVVWKQTTAGEK